MELDDVKARAKDGGRPRSLPGSRRSAHAAQTAPERAPNSSPERSKVARPLAWQKVPSSPSNEADDRFSPRRA